MLESLPWLALRIAECGDMEQWLFGLNAFLHAFNNHIWITSVCVAAANVLLLQPLKRADKEDRFVQVQ